MSGPPTSARRLGACALFAATALALVNLPADELPPAWLCAFTLPGAVLGAWPGLARSPWWRALLAVLLQALACWAALELVGPMTRPAALACTILPPLAFCTTRNHETDPALGLFLGFCVLLVGTILDGPSTPLLIGWGAAAFLSLRSTTLLYAHRIGRTPRAAAPTPRGATLATTSSLLLASLVAVFALERALQCLPSPSRAAQRDAAAHSADARRQAGLDDSFVLDGSGGLLEGLAGEQLVRAHDPNGGDVPPSLYLRCGFFAEPSMDRWLIGTLATGPASHPTGHVLRRPVPRAPLRELEIERYAGAQQFVFLPADACIVDGLEDLVVDPVREWIRPRVPNEDVYRVTWQELPSPSSGSGLDPRARDLGLFRLPRGMDQDAFVALLERWGAAKEPVQAMATIADGLARHCRYQRMAPVGPFRHAIENFLFADEDRHGFCMHFATAAALMLRLLQIPCRIGVGLYGGGADPADPKARIYGSQHAHAWVEVPFADRGYVIFDPTPPALRGRGFVPDTSSAEFVDRTAAVGGGALEPALRSVAEALQAPWLWALVVLVALTVAMLPRRRAEAPTPSAPPVARQARRLLLRLLRALADAGDVRARGQTLESFARDLAARERLLPEVESAFLAYQEVRFGGRSFDAARSATIERAVRAVREREPAAQAGAAAGQ